ncbi:MAG TPA: NAD(P)(+) transhydrogenase (Re/Si-specific) subunit beta [Verrucomicrobiaceae bacterium]|jgi:NAD(P) transhydrogenase subunit beta
MMSTGLAIAFLAAAVLFIVGIKLLGSPRTARRGNIVAAVGMIIALLATLPLMHGAHDSKVPVMNILLIAIGILAGLGVGAYGAYSVKMTEMPQMVALFNGAGGGAAALVAALEFVDHAGETRPEWFTLAMLFAVLIGAVSFSGSIIAFLKLEGKFEKPLTYPGQQFGNAALFMAMIALGVKLAGATHATGPLIGFLVFALTFGVLMVLPIGGADMPVVISLLNSFTGLAVAADGFAISNISMIIAGTLVGSSGTLLTLFMCQAMNRPVTNVLFGAFGKAVSNGASAAEVGGTVKPIQADEAALLMSIAGQVVIVPGYGLAVAQAQHQVRELADDLGRLGVEVSYAIHPVAGRMPGHMNVLLAEASVPYDQLVEMEAINPQMDRVDVCLVIGANDVVNPAAREDKSSPIYGMPIIEAEKAKTVIVLKRSMGKGFAGIENHLFYRDNCRMLFGDAKASLQALVAGVKDA